MVGDWVWGCEWSSECEGVSDECVGVWKVCEWCVVCEWVVCEWVTDAWVVWPLMGGVWVVCVCVKVVCECVGGIGSDNKISNPSETCKNHMNQVPRPGISFIQYGRVTRRLKTHPSTNMCYRHWSIQLNVTYYITNYKKMKKSRKYVSRK